MIFRHRGSAMKPFTCAATCLFALVVVAGCASTEVTEQKSYVGDEKIARPDRIIVYDFAATPADVPADSVLTGSYAEHGTPQTAEEIEAGRKLGGLVAYADFQQYAALANLRADVGRAAFPRCLES